MKHFNVKPRNESELTLIRQLKKQAIDDGLSFTDIVFNMIKSYLEVKSNEKGTENK